MVSKAYKENYDRIDWTDLKPVVKWRHPRGPRSDISFPMVIRDEMDEAYHVDGRTYTSKSAYRKVTRERGFIEIGNEEIPHAPKPQKRNPGQIKDSLRRADYTLRNHPSQTRIS